MYDNSLFEQLVRGGNSTGEVVGVDRFLISVKGLEGVAAGALVLFETGQHGMVREVGLNLVLVLNLSTENTPLGTLVVIQDNILSTGVGEGLIGRVVTPLCQPLDGKGPIQLSDAWPVFNDAPGIMERAILNDQLPTGVSMVDLLFPVVLGQRIAILGDTKSGKTSFLLQLGVNQLNTERIVIYVLIGKRRVDIDQLVNRLNETGAIEHSIVIVANIFDSLAQSYLAPYIGCTMAEYLWKGGKDVIIVYDDLSSHAKVYRELSLLSGVSPGRDSYPGDMFFAHSSLLERAGKLKANEKTLTVLPVVVTPNDDITAYLPTSIMSITDGQLIFDLTTFRQNIKPAINAGLSVSRVGGRALTPKQKTLSGALFKRLAEYRQAKEFSHYGSDLAPESQVALMLGGLINDAFRQSPSDLFNLIEQQIILQVVLTSAGQAKLNMMQLKKRAKELALTINAEGDIDTIANQLLQEVTIEAVAQK
jgi:F-type H+/Na+-transporting ATPase subunit alpha